MSNQPQEKSSMPIPAVILLGTLLIAAILIITALINHECEHETYAITLVEPTEGISPSDLNLNKLADEHRAHIYGEKLVNYGGAIATRYVCEYRDLGDLLNAKLDRQSTAEIHIFWYGYDDTRPYEKITVTIDPEAKSFKYHWITITSTCGEQESIIYQSSKRSVGYGTSYYISPSLTVETFYRDQFQEAVASGDIPAQVVDFDIPSDADYVCKAAFKFNFS